MAKLTKRMVDALRPTPADQVIFDDEVAGFGIRVKPSGRKSWLIQYRNTHGQSKRLTLGSCSVLTPDQARSKAKRELAAVLDGADPAATRRSQRGAVTVAELCDQYLEARKGTMKAATLAMDRSRIETHVKPLLGSRPVASLLAADLEKFLKDVMAGKSAPNVTSGTGKLRGGKPTGGPGAAARTLGMLGTILERAVRDGLLQKNPVRGIARPKDRSKAPAFAFATVAALGKSMDVLRSQGENKTGLNAIRFLLLTGCRRMEALTLRWDMIDIGARCLRFKDTKSGQQNRPIGRTAISLLKSFKPADAQPTDYVFPGALKDAHLVGLPKIWARVAKHAGIADVSLHGLRHWFASAAAEMNFSVLTIAGLLGHRVKGVTARYANAPDVALLAAADKVSERLGATLESKRSKRTKSLRAR